MAWVSLTLDVPVADSDAVQARLNAAGAGGLEVRDGDIKPIPGVRMPNAGDVIVIGYFEKAAQADAALHDVRAHVKKLRAERAEVPDTDWSVAWRDRVKPVTIGRLWVGPPWEVKNAPPGKVQLVIEPRMAFGTGDHPTTALCLAAVDDYLAAHPGASVLDVGTGTGVLAFAAKKLGAGRCVGTDNDAVAIELAHEYAQENGLTGIALSTQTPEQVEGTFDLVLANILANTLIVLAPRIAAKVKHHLELAGVLVPQGDEVVAAYVAQGLQPLRRTVQGEWVRLELLR
jgi:ribosomal protein L11 methyltransferase